MRTQMIEGRGHNGATTAPASRSPSQSRRGRGVLSVVALQEHESLVEADLASTLTLADADVLWHRRPKLVDALPMLTRADFFILELAPNDGPRLAALADLRELVRLPIIAVIPNGAVLDRVLALEAGADVCLNWPFDRRELLALCRSSLRRLDWERTPQAATLPFYQDVELEVNLDRRYVIRDGRAVGLSATEVAILRVLLATPGQVVPYDSLLREVWGNQTASDNHVLREAVRRLRRKIEPNVARPRYLLTRPWVGLWFQPHGAGEAS